MNIIKSIGLQEKTVLVLKRRSKTIAFVPTMGALHEGHLSLIKNARKEADIVIVSIFVNPTQFGPKEDYKKYPRTFSKDVKLLKEIGVDYVFSPKVKDMYPDGFSTYIFEDDLSNCLCGKSRPGHFNGVLTVVLKLFNIVQPDIAYFGQKDYQQLVMIKKMVKDLNLPIKIRILPTKRDKNGLALSSRNSYLSDKKYNEALSLYKMLKIVKKTRSLSEGKRNIKKVKLKKLDYLIAVDSKTLKPVKKIKKGNVVLIAAKVGKTRLIDNVIV